MIYDLIVIGGGPAGVMAAGRAAEKSARVLLLEKNSRLGLKLLISGKGRCNVTNVESEIKKFIDNFGVNGKFLWSALNKFSVQDVISFFESKGLPLKVERGHRVFPESDKAKDVLEVLSKYLQRNKVDIKFESGVENIEIENNKIKEIILVNGEKLMARNYLIATGGKSYPLTGSSGDAYKWLLKMGHKIIEPRPALVPIILQENWIKDLEGLSLKNVSINVYQNKKVDSRFGEAIFTAKGLSGPIILDMSKHIGELLKQGQVNLEIDYKPALSFDVLDKRIQQDFIKLNNKMFKNSLDMLLPRKLIPVIIKLSGIDPEKKVNAITREERKKILHLLKNFRLTVKELDGFNKAIVTTGGVDLKEVDPQTMQSKIIKNLYLAGEILDLDGVTGGFNLQAAWSTGYVAGENI